MTCDHCRSLIDDYIDGAAGDRSAVEAHLAGCEACRVMAADFGAIRRTARSLDRHTPPPQVWASLSRSLQAERLHSARTLTTWRLLAAAAVLVIAVGGAWMLTRQTGSSAPPRTAAVSSATPVDSELAQSVETELKLAEEHYQRAIAGLEQITRSESSALDPQVAAVLQKNLAVIDHAIVESRAALQAQPASDVAQESLFEALRNKVALLQDTIVLINEMRKGNPEGTARAVSGLNQ